MKTALFALAIWAMHTAAEAAPMPQKGACEQEDWLFPMRVAWSGDEANVLAYGKKYTGKVAGMRVHGEHFKLSVFFDDELAGLSEIVIFALGASGSINYRMGIVTYDRTHDGEKLVSSMSGFADATCVVVH
jgi:hypothetical protein